MKVLLIGSNGQLGWELQRCCPPEISLTAVDYPEIDLQKTNNIVESVSLKDPDVIINAAAYTAVDKAEQEPETADVINHIAVAKLAEAAKYISAHFVHISTDFVFSGNACKPYLPTDKAEPQSVYGMSKLKGELAARDILREDVLIIRTAWLYSAHGNNFVKTMLRLMRERETLNVVDDQIGTPAWAYGLAQVVWSAVQKNLKGIYHWTDSGVASWYDFAMAIQEEAYSLKLLDRLISIYPIPTEDYPTPAKRPFFSVLDKRSTSQILNVKHVHWRIQLHEMFKELI